MIGLKFSTLGVNGAILFKAIILVCRTNLNLLSSFRSNIYHNETSCTDFCDCFFVTQVMIFFFLISYAVASFILTKSALSNPIFHLRVLTKLFFYMFHFCLFIFHYSYFSWCSSIIIIAFSFILPIYDVCLKKFKYYFVSYLLK